MSAPVLITLAAGVEILRLGLAGRAGSGNGGNNLLLGNAEANRLVAGGGSNVLEGRGGNDTLVGGPGRDSFVMRRGDGTDRIEAFTPGQDQMVLTGFGLDAQALLARASMTDEGAAFDLGGGDGFLLVGLSPAQLLPSDFVLWG